MYIQMTELLFNNIYNGYRRKEGRYRKEGWHPKHDILTPFTNHIWHFVSWTKFPLRTQHVIVISPTNTKRGWHLSFNYKVWLALKSKLLINADILTSIIKHR